VRKPSLNSNTLQNIGNEGGQNNGEIQYSATARIKTTGYIRVTIRQDQVKCKGEAHPRTRHEG
jgi:hypothetical protein